MTSCFPQRIGSFQPPHPSSCSSHPGVSQASLPSLPLSSFIFQCPRLNVSSEKPLLPLEVITLSLFSCIIFFGITIGQEVGQPFGNGVHTSPFQLGSSWKPRCCKSSNWIPLKSFYSKSLYTMWESGINHREINDNTTDISSTGPKWMLSYWIVVSESRGANPGPPRPTCVTNSAEQHGFLILRVQAHQGQLLEGSASFTLSLSLVHGTWLNVCYMPDSREWDKSSPYVQEAWSSKHGWWYHCQGNQWLERPEDDSETDHSELMVLDWRDLQPTFIYLCLDDQNSQGTTKRQKEAESH